MQIKMDERVDFITVYRYNIYRRSGKEVDNDNKKRASREEKRT